MCPATPPLHPEPLSGPLVVHSHLSTHSGTGRHWTPRKEGATPPPERLHCTVLWERVGGVGVGCNGFATTLQRFRGGRVVKAHRLGVSLNSRLESNKERERDWHVRVHCERPCVVRPGLGTDRYSSQFENNYFTEMCSGSEAGSYLRLIDCCITQL